MHPVYRAWWRALMDLRPTVRFLAERFPKLAPWGIRARWAAHLAVGNPIQSLAGFDAVMLWHHGALTFWWALGLLVGVCGFAEIGHRMAYRSGGLVVGWREAWRFRRKFPAEWAGIAAKTTRVQAEVGTSKEPIASAVLRPVADHPKLSWWPRISWPVVSWWVGPPPGRSFSSLDELTTVLAANVSRAADIYLDYERENDSHGRLVVAFGNVLAEPSSPTWTTAPAGPVPVDDGDGVVVDDFDAALDAFDSEQPVLRVVDGEATS
jgi:hypothetical protein